MAAAACGQHSVAISVTVSGKKTHSNREYNRRNRENSRRRQAALLFLSNISLDGRPVQSNGAEEEGSHHHHKDTDLERVESSSAAPGLCLEPCNSTSCGTFSTSSASVSYVKGNVTPSPVPRSGLLPIPPILVLPSDAGFNDAEVLLQCRRGSFPSPGSNSNNLLTPSPSNTSLLPSPVGPRKSSTLLSVQSCNSVSSEPRHR